jgi:hypothetical protein
VVSGDAGGNTVVHGVGTNRTIVLPVILLAEYRSFYFIASHCQGTAVQLRCHGNAAATRLTFP